MKASPLSSSYSGTHTAAFFLILLLSILFGYNLNPKRSVDPADVYNALGRRLQKTKQTAKAIKSNPKDISFALGYNVCIDAILRFQGVVDAVDAEKANGVVPRDVDVVKSHDDVLALFVNQFTQGAAAERSCNPEIFKVLVDRAKKASDVRENLGGNAALMARQLAKLGVKELLIGGNVGPLAAEMLPAGASFASPAGSAPTSADEVHLILEYSKGDKFGKHSSPRANRLILTADVSNLNAQALIDTIKSADSSGSDVLVIAGLHMLEPLPAEKRAAVLRDIAAAIKGRRTSYTIHLELASMADTVYMRDIATTLFPLVDSIGFNEQEAAFLYESLGGKFATVSEDGSVTAPGLLGSGIKGGRKSITSNTNADVSSIASLLRFLFEKFPNAFSRVHFHSLGYHIVAYSGKSAVAGAISLAASKEAIAAANGALKRMSEDHPDGGAATVRRWKATTASVAAGAVTATREACQLPLAGKNEDGTPTSAAAAEASVTDSLVHFAAPLDVFIADPRKPSSSSSASASSGSPPAQAKDDFTTPHARLFMSSMAPAAEFVWNSTTAGPLRFTIAPVAVCNKPVSTVGLGDAISAAGLAYDAITVGEVEDLLVAAETEEADALEHSWPILRVVRRLKDRVMTVVTKVKEQLA